MMQFWLEFESGGQQQRFDFDQKTVSIGRDQTSDFHLDHPTVSRQHALIVVNQGSFQLVVLSRNGLTAVDGEKVSGTVDLSAGQTLQLGEVQLAFRAPGGQQNFGEAPTEHLNLSDIDGSAPTMGMPAVDESTEPSRHSHERPALAVGKASDVETDAMEAVGGPNPFNQGLGGSGFPQQPKGLDQDSSPKQPNGFGQQPSSFGPASDSSASAKPPEKKKGNDHGIKSWDEIAAEAATGPQVAVGGPTDFERIQKAQAKATKKSQGTSPVMLVLLVLAVGGLAGLFLWEPDDTRPPPPPPSSRCEGLNICYKEGEEPTCPNKEECVAKAIAAYQVADELYKRQGANITNLYEAYKQLDKADRFLTQAGVTAPPDEMKDYKARIEKYLEELNAIAKDHRIRHHQLQQRHMNWKMAENVRAWQSFFPDRKNIWWKEAIEVERRMKDSGTWPKKFDKK